jgi:hypothetical protein
MKKTIVVILLASILVASAFAATPVFAKNLNTSPARVIYFDGGSAVIALPSPLTNYPPGSWPTTPTVTAPLMKISCTHIEIPNSGVDSYGMLVQFYQTSSANHTLHWEPQAFFTTDPDMVSSIQSLWSGTFIEFPGTYYNKLYNIKTFVDTDNVKLVSDQAFQVERHGNNVFINYVADPAAPVKITRPNGIAFSLPTFSLELNGYGGSLHTTEVVPMNSWPLASGYTLEINEVGFSATGAFTCPTWGYIGQPTANSEVTMHGVQYNIPPAPV